MNLFQDWKANSGNTKGQLILFLFRIAQAASKGNLLTRIFFWPYLAFYRLIVVWILGIELPLNGFVGPRLRLYHGQSLVVFGRVSIGADVTLRHCTTIGAKQIGDKYLFPTIQDGVDIGCNSVVLGDITIGANSVIGAGSVVLKSTARGSVFAGNPAKQLR